MKVLIVKTSALGDIIHALPVLDYLHRAMPGVEIDWVVEEPFKEVLEGHPHIARLHTVRTKIWRKHPFASETRRELSALKKEMRERAYDLVLDIQGNLKSGFVSWLSHCDDRVGFARDSVRESINLLFTTRQIPLRRDDFHVTERYLRLASVPFGKDYRKWNDLSGGIFTSASDNAPAEALMSTLGNGLVFLFHCGTSWQTKMWKEEGWIDLGQRLLATHPESSLLFSWGSDSEREMVLRISRAIGAGARLLQRYSLKELVGLLKKVDLVIAGDTGPLHMAAAVGTPTVSFYRATDGKLNGPRGSNHVIVQSPLPCTKCLLKACDREDECRGSITAEALFNGVAKVLGE